jgi:hypothetical protein
MCELVGGSFNSANVTVTLAEFWNGTHSTIQSTANAPGATTNVLDSVSCPSTAVCFALGYTYPSASSTSAAPSGKGFPWPRIPGLLEIIQQPLKDWRLQSAPLPPGATSLVLTGVSCSSGTQCVLVGSYYNTSFLQIPFAESWNGIAWFPDSINSPGGYGSELLGASCATGTTVCTAVGGSFNGAGVAFTLAERN